ncbi:MAG: transcriptional repressor [Alphaproteobacteria bacterium]|jgi:Fur family transcriptional regulator, ferric uptake regulator|nr:transcriptional repressor [Alphaproteobacteria bacterium]MBP7729573.1 transcriptional repressor [Alphaproteobacteria bacterium]
MILSSLEHLCQEKGLRMTPQRRIIARVLSESKDHPDVEAVYSRVNQVDSKISLATVYRTLRLFEDAHILYRHEFGDGKSRYEKASSEHHHHLIDLHTGQIIEFHDEHIETLQKKIAENLGYNLMGHRLELYGVPFKADRKKINTP